MFETIKMAIQKNDIESLSSEEMYYTYKWIEEGRFDNLEISNDFMSLLTTFMCCNF